MLRMFLLLLLALPTGCYAGQYFNNLIPVASYVSTSHGLIVASIKSPSRFIIVFRNKSLRLAFTGTGFIKTNAKTPDEALLNKAGESREDGLAAQAKHAFASNEEKPIKMGILNRSGYRVIRYSLPIYSGDVIMSLGARIVVTKNNCRWMWETKDYAATAINIFHKNAQTYLSAIMYAAAPDGDSPVVRIFRIPVKCHT